MPTLNDKFFDGLMAIYFGVFAVAFLFNLLFRQRLKNFHSHVWQQLGSPSFSNNSIQNGFRATTFLLRRRYESLNDSTLAFYGRWARTGFLAILAFLLLFLALIIVAQIRNGVWRQHVVVNHPLKPAGALFLGLVLVHMMLIVLLERYLKTRHVDLWKELGRPSLLNTTFTNSWSVLQFIWSRRYEQLKDRCVGLCVWTVRLTTVLLVGTFLWGFLRQRF